MKNTLLSDILFGGFFGSILDHEVYQCILSFLVACFLSIISIPIIINLSNLLNLTAKPGFRSSHSTDTPTLGGIALFACTLIAFFLWPHAEETQDSNLTSLSMVGLTILFFLGLKDDILALDSAKKLIVQIGATLTLVVMGNFKVDYLYGIFGWHYIPDFVSIPLTIFIFIALINAINLIDGIDGLAAGISLITGLGLGTWFIINRHFTFGCLAFSMSGALLGFLRFNFSKTSKIFMGDTGSLVIGFLLSFFTIEFLRLNVGYRNDPTVFFNAPIIVMVMLIVPIFDTLRVFIVRLIQGGSPFIADRNHLHHILVDNGLNHFQASFTLWMVTIVNMILFFSFHGDVSNTDSLYIYIGLFVLYMFAAYLLKRRATFVKEKKGMVKSPSYSGSSLSPTKKILRNL
ncbi:MraY family glycosyltransferase [Rhabdobacter roseus]|uniref:UDP-N-acetylmuramyl pentapeptide phosphotransferase/UDP-N-acetylglucosamine-1-phosphate transferase n=1 Tax=Rhabdobacter roseus TaxID=1655419 RepID=A0A840TQH7_9BACT|nr:MraY family glycosyltransferase [Rhabdobacter roseus]MBB5283493.1 UDP-N-acetylmuramyl pentapeptide phosphotransferase/UDP-N-acetylglucosamine-1-phosphate transferase [Rhabdobacter roseus]